VLEVVSLPHQKKWILKHSSNPKLSLGEGIKGWYSLIHFY